MATSALLLLSSLIAPMATAAGEEAPDTLAGSRFDLDEVVVTATRVPKLLKDTPVQTRLITRKDIENSDATDIRDLLQQEMPGLEFTYAMNQQVHLNFNGQGGQSVLFLLDGERLAGETMDDVDFSRLNMDNVERIEIVKGASSALYGSNAGGGVINVITRRAAEKWRVTGGARIGKHNDQRYNLSLTLGGKYVKNVLSGNYSSIDNYDVHSKPNPVTRVVSTIYGNRVWNFSDRLTVTPIESLRITGRAGFFYRQMTRTEDVPERYRDYSAGLSADWDITAADALSVSYAFDQYDKSDYYRLSHLDVRGYSNVQNSVRALSGVKNVEYRDYYDISKGTVTVDYPAYTLWKLQVVQQFGKYVKLTLAVDNLLNYKPDYYYLNCPLTDGASFLAGVSFDFQ